MVFDFSCGHPCCRSEMRCNLLHTEHRPAVPWCRCCGVAGPYCGAVPATLHAVSHVLPCELRAASHDDVYAESDLARAAIWALMSVLKIPTCRRIVECLRP